MFLLDGGVNRHRTRLRVENLVLVVVVVAVTVAVVALVFAADTAADFDLGRRLWAKTFKTWSVSNLWEWRIHQTTFHKPDFCNIH